MLEATEVNLNELREAVKALNGSDLVESKIKVIGKKKEDILNLFAEMVEAVPDEQANDLPVEVVVFYNKVFGDDDYAPDIPDKVEDDDNNKNGDEKDIEEEDVIVKSKEPSPKKKEGEKKSAPKEDKPKAKKEKKEKDEFGFVIGTGANLIDRAIIDSGKKGVTLAEMEEMAGRKVGTHIYVLTKYKGLPIVKKENRYYYEP